MKKSFSFNPLAYLLALALPASLLAAPVVSNVAFVQQPDGNGSTEVVVTYDLASPNGNATVSLLYSLDATSFVPAITVSGDVGPVETTGTLTLSWAVATDLPGVQSSSLTMRVVAEDSVAIPLTISGTVADGGLTNNLNQTLTFTFDEPVTGFDASEVTVTNATKGAFAGSGATYTLDIIVDSDGPVTASVAAEVATAASGTGNLSAAPAPFGFNVDATPPTIIARYPGPGGSIRHTSPQITVTFSEPVIGLTPGQMKLGHLSASFINGTNPCTFYGFGTFLPLGIWTVQLIPGSATDLAGNPIAATSWDINLTNPPR